MNGKKTVVTEDSRKWLAKVRAKDFLEKLGDENYDSPEFLIRKSLREAGKYDVHIKSADLWLSNVEATKIRVYKNTLDGDLEWRCELLNGDVITEESRMFLSEDFADERTFIDGIDIKFADLSMKM